MSIGSFVPILSDQAQRIAGYMNLTLMVYELPNPSMYFCWLAARAPSIKTNYKLRL